MNAPLRESAVTSALVHQSALVSPALYKRHTAFIAKRLAVAFIALGAAPFFLAFRGAPNGTETLVFACSFAPLAAALVAARTGRLVAAHGIACLGLSGLGLSLYALCGDPGIVVAWGLAGLFEAALSDDKRLWAAGATLCVALLMAVGTATALHLAPASSTWGAAVSAALALLYAVVIGTGAERTDDGTASTFDRDQREICDAALRLFGDLVVGFDPAGSVTDVRANGTSWLGLATSDLIGRGLFECVHIADRPGFLKIIADAAYAEHPEPARLRLRRLVDLTTDAPSRPTYVWVEMRAAAMRSGASDTRVPSPVVAVLRDAETALARDVEVAAAQTSLEESIQSKDHFLASMSHELRTPLNAIIGFSEMLGSHTLRPVGPDKQLEYARIIHQSGLHLLSVVNSMLDMSKIRAGSFSIVPEPFDAVPLLDLACDMIDLKAQEGRIDLVRDYPETLEEMVGDKRACKQILINLLSNAVKFTPAQGTVTLSARPEGNSLAIVVRDTGIGIAAGDLARLGDPFFQAGSSLSRPFEGTGLGLSVVRGLVGLHGGTIAIESELGRGTCVQVQLPLDCRTINGRSASAAIEVLARHQVFEPHFAPPAARHRQIARVDQRMKQSA